MPPEPTAPAPDTDADTAEEWLGRREAAEILGVSERQVQRRAEKGYIQVKIIPRKLHEKSHTTLYNRADIAAVLIGKPNTYPVLVEIPADAPQPPQNAKEQGSTTAGLTRYAPTEDPFHGMPAFLAQTLSQVVSHLTPAPAATPPPVLKPWLTLAEAAEFSGLPAAYLRKAAETGAVTAIRTGNSARRPNWRFHADTLTTTAPGFSRS